MKSLFILLFALASTCGGSVSQQGALDKKGDGNSTIGDCDGPEHFDMVFYNVENLFDTKNDPQKKDDDFTPEGRNEWGAGRYEKKIKNLSRVIQSMDYGNGEAAIIGLAEVENRAVVEDLGNTIVPNGYATVHKDSYDMRGIDLALLYKKDMVKKLDEEFIRIEFSDRGYTSRDILYFKGQIGREIIHVLLNHWPSRREGQQESEHRRLDAARTLKKKVEQIKKKDDDAQIVIMGDFNDYPDNKSITSVLDAQPKDSKKKDELVNLAYDLHAEDKGTYSYKGDWGMLDQAIVSDNLLNGGGLGVCGEALEIHWKEFFMFYDRKYKEYKPNRTYGGPKYYGGYSDHLPILLHLHTTD